MPETNLQEFAIDEPSTSNRPSVRSSKFVKIALVAIISLVFLNVLISTATLMSTSGLYKFLFSREATTVEPKIKLNSPPENTSCDRNCTDGDTRTCKFTWNVSYYYSFINGTDRPCGNCPFNISDCYRDECIPLNGLQRRLVTVNRQVPGPKIVVCKNDIIYVTVNNHLEDMTGITFHWHGIDQFYSPAMDGTSMITQCPIPFGLSFDYKFRARNAGTYFWHSHVGSNRADGLAGPLIVREAHDPHAGNYRHDLTNHILMIQDWMNITQNENYVKYLYSGGTNQPDFILINGRGKGPVARKLENGSSEIAYTPREVLTVKGGERYRIRLISNGFTGCPMKVSVDNHRLAAIAMDGFSINMVPFDSLIANAGERFDFILNANQTPDNYWLRVEGIGNNCNGTEEKPGLQELAIIRYLEASYTDPKAPERNTTDAGVVFNPSERQMYNKSIRIVNLTSLTQFDANEKVSTYYLSVGSSKRKTDDLVLRKDKKFPQINQISFEFPPVPLLTQHNEANESLFCDARKASKWSSCRTQLCSCAQIITAELNETIELFFYNGTNGTNGTACHPMHLHGFSYRVVGSGLMDEEYTPEEVEKMDNHGEFFRLSTQFPPIKDTVCVSHGSYMIIQFVADNPGWWFLHCHLDFHALLGMAMVVRVGKDEHLKGIPSNFPRCQNFKMPKP